MENEKIDIKYFGAQTSQLNGKNSNAEKNYWFTYVTRYFFNKRRN